MAESSYFQLHFHRGDGKTVLNDFVPGMKLYSNFDSFGDERNLIF